VEDNGYKETDHDAINRLIVNEPSDGSSGYGIRNVNKRIQLHFGNVYGLRYEAREKEGTRVTVIIPKRTAEHYKEAQ
jgi:two-component system sensor histidine kinase YesM